MASPNHSPNKPRPIQERFNNAVEVIRSLPKEGPFQPSNTVKLRFYALFKQANTGPCNIAKPAFWDATGRAKWEAWNVCGNMSKELAMQMYVEELQQLVETMPQTKEVEQFLKSIGPFYELADTEQGGSEEIPGEQHEENPKVNKSENEGDTEEEEDESEEESGGESDVSEDFQESFQNLPITSPSDQSFELVSPYTPRTQSQNHLQSEQPLPTHSEEEVDGPRNSRSPLQTGTAKSPATKTRPAGQTRRPASSTTTSSTHLSIIRDHTGAPSPLVVGGGPGRQGTCVTVETNPDGSGGNSSGESFPLGLEVVVSQLSSLQQNVQSMVQQVNALVITVHGLTQQYIGNTGMEMSQDVGNLSEIQPQLIVRRGRVLTLLIRLGPLLVIWPLIVNLIMLYLSKRYKSGELPIWVWGMVTLVHACFSVALTYYNRF